MCYFVVKWQLVQKQSLEDKTYRYQSYLYKLFLLFMVLQYQNNI